MPVTLRIAGRANTRLGVAASNVPVVVRDVGAGTPSYTGTTDPQGYYNSGLLDDTKVYRTEIEYDPTNNYKALRDLASGQMGMLQVRERFHVWGAATPCVIDGPASVGAGLTVVGNASFSANVVMASLNVSAGAVIGGTLNAAQLQIGAQNLDDRFVNVNEKAATAATADNALALGGVAPAGYSVVAHVHPAHEHDASYSLLSHTHAYGTGTIKAMNGSYLGNGGNNVNIITAPGVIVMATIWEANGAGRGAVWHLDPFTTATGQMNTSTADEVVDATGRCSVMAGRLIIQIGRIAGGSPDGGANGVGANLNGITYGYAVLHL
jgi:hypothetical protein